MCTNLSIYFIHRGLILYDDKPITNGSFDILALTLKEQREVGLIAGDNPGWAPHPANLLALGTVGEEPLLKSRKVFCYAAPKLLYVQEYILKIIPLKIATYRVSPMTKVLENWLFCHFFNRLSQFSRFFLLNFR